MSLWHFSANTFPHQYEQVLWLKKGVRKKVFQLSYYSSKFHPCDQVYSVKGKASGPSLINWFKANHYLLSFTLGTYNIASRIIVLNRIFKPYNSRAFLFYIFHHCPQERDSSHRSRDFQQFQTAACPRRAWRSLCVWHRFTWSWLVRWWWYICCTICTSGRSARCQDSWPPIIWIAEFREPPRVALAFAKDKLRAE